MGAMVELVRLCQFCQCRGAGVGCTLTYSRAARCWIFATENCVLARNAGGGHGMGGGPFVCGGVAETNFTVAGAGTAFVGTFVFG